MIERLHFQSVHWFPSSKLSSFCCINCSVHWLNSFHPINSHICIHCLSTFKFLSLCSFWKSICSEEQKCSTTLCRSFFFRDIYIFLVLQPATEIGLIRVLCHQSRQTRLFVEVLMTFGLVETQLCSASHPETTITTIKHGGGSIMLNVTLSILLAWLMPSFSIHWLGWAIFLLFF